MGEKTIEAQKLADEGNKHLLIAIKKVEAIEKLACSDGNMEAMIAANGIIMAMREAKDLGMKADGLLNLQVKGGGS